MSGATPACRIKINAAGDWQIVPPAGQITRIGDLGATAYGLVNNDDLFISGKAEILGRSYFLAEAEYYGAAVFYGSMRAQDSFLINGEDVYEDDRGSNSADLYRRKTSEVVTIPIASGAAGVNSVTNLARSDSIIDAVTVRVIQAPGGGATTFSVGRTGGNIDEFVQTLAVALGTIGTSAADGDGVNTGPVHNAADNTFVITTDVNVTITDMQIRINIWYRELSPPTS